MKSIGKIRMICLTYSKWTDAESAISEILNECDSAQNEAEETTEVSNSTEIMMTLDEIKENLCYNDLRNPNVTVDEETAKEIADADCYCDNCFRGKTALAEELLRYYYMVNEKKRTVPKGYGLQQLRM